jgi:hypothetical protein
VEIRDSVLSPRRGYAPAAKTATGEVIDGEKVGRFVELRSWSDRKKG